MSDSLDDPVVQQIIESLRREVAEKELHQDNAAKAKASQYDGLLERAMVLSSAYGELKTKYEKLLSDYNDLKGRAQR